MKWIEKGEIAILDGHRYRVYMHKIDSPFDTIAIGYGKNGTVNLDVLPVDIYAMSYVNAWKDKDPLDGYYVSHLIDLPSLPTFKRRS